jgi:hypothetical protein
MRSWWFAVVCVACGGGGSGGDAGSGSAIDAVYNVALVAGSNQQDACDLVGYAALLTSSRTIAISGSGVVVSGSALAIPDTTATDVQRSGSDLSFFVQWQTASGSGHTSGNESYELSGDATQLSGIAQGTYDKVATFTCALSFAVTTTSLGSGG